MADKKKKSANTLMPNAPAIWAGAGDAKWRAEDDHRAVTMAGEVMRDKDRMKGVKEHHKKLNKDMEKACK